MRRYIMGLVRISAIMAGCIAGPGALIVLLTLFIPTTVSSGILLIMCLLAAVAVFGICMLPALRFIWMIRRQEKLGHSFPSEEPTCISKDWTGTYLTRDWLIYAGIHALHYSQIAAIHGRRVHPGTYASGHIIIVKTIHGRTHRWHLSQRNTKLVRDWLKAHQPAR